VNRVTSSVRHRVLDPAGLLNALTTTATMGVTWPEPISQQHPTDNDQHVDDRDEDPPGAPRGEPVDQHPDRTEQNNDEPQPQEVPRQGRPRPSWPTATTGTAGAVILPLRPPDRMIPAPLNAHTRTVHDHVKRGSHRSGPERGRPERVRGLRILNAGSYWGS
jgi:hypothetical protein